MKLSIVITNHKRPDEGHLVVLPLHRNRVELLLERQVDPSAKCGSIQVRYSATATEVLDLEDGDEITLKISDIILQENEPDQIS